MKQLFGIANNNIYLVESLLQKYQEENGKLRVQVMGFEDQPKKKAQVVLIPQVKTLSDNLKALQKMDCVVIVFDCPVLCDYLEPITLLDVAKRSPSFKYTFKPLEYPDFKDSMQKALKSGKVKVKKEYIDVIPKLLGAQLSSVLNPIMTFLYRIKDTDRRLDYQKLVMEWLVSGASEKVLSKAIMGMGDFKKEPKALTNLLEFFGDKNKESQNARQALREALDCKLNKKPISYKKLSKKYQIEAFDIRYTLAVLRKFGRYEKIDKDIKELFTHRREKFKARKAAEKEENE